MQYISMRSESTRASWRARRAMSTWVRDSPGLSKGMNARIAAGLGLEEYVNTVLRQMQYRLISEKPELSRVISDVQSSGPR